MAISGVPGVTAQVQIPIPTKENTPSEERDESRAQKAAEAQKVAAARVQSPSPKGTGHIVNRKA